VLQLSIIFILMFVLMSCAPLQILPGLCYKDKTGTYLCPEEEDYRVLLKIETKVNT
ncbi:uncharacterized protein METZ01_LOCUS344926, partial [marine metagenome]